MNDGEEFEIPNFVQMNPQQQLDILDINDDVEYKYRHKRPEGVRPKKKDLTEEWLYFLEKVSRQANLDMAIFILMAIDPKLTKDVILANIKLLDVPKIVNQLFRVGLAPKKRRQKKIGVQPRSKS